MAIGDVREVQAGDCTDLYYLDTGMYDTEAYGSVYIIDDERPAVVDTGIGTNYDLLRAALDEVGIGREDLAVIAPTHVHLDHAGGAGKLAQDYPNATVVCHEVGAPHLVDPSRLWKGTKRAVGEQIQFYAEPEPVPGDRLRELTDGDVVALGDHELQVVYTPGHAPHHVAFYDPANDAVFAADSAGIYVPALDQIEPTSPPPNFDFDQCLDDIDTVASFDPAVLLYAHFGPVEGTAVLDEYRDTLTKWVERIERTRAELDDDDAVIEYFVEDALARDDLRGLWGELKLRAETTMNVQGVLRYLDTREE